jgi:L-threonylcarbamoyladenylate synthase
MTAVTKQNPQVVAANEAGIARAVAILRAGGIAALPTETVYGLAVDAANVKAIGEIFAAKGRSDTNPLVVQISTLEAAQKLGVFSATAKRLAEEFWPGPLTLVLPYCGGAAVARAARGGLETIGLRIPAQETTLAILAQTGPLAVTSANRSGHAAATTAVQIARELGGCVDIILDAGAAPLGIVSTIIEVIGDKVALLRQGAVPSKALKIEP